MIIEMDRMRIEALATEKSTDLKGMNDLFMALIEDVI